MSARMSCRATITFMGPQSLLMVANDGIVGNNMDTSASKYLAALANGQIGLGN